MSGEQEKKSKTEGNKGNFGELRFWGTRENAYFFRGTREQVPPPPGRAS